MKTVLITGSTSGIGKATALLFAKRGYSVIINGRDEKRGKEVATETGGVFLRADVTNPKQVAQMFAQIKQLDVLVNNAGGVVGNDSFENATTMDLDLSFKTNFYSTFYCCQEAIKIMESGAIINVGSVCGVSDNPSGESEAIPIYSAAKAAIHNLSQNLARVLAPKIRVNTIVPGFTKTPAWDSEFTQRSEEDWAKGTLIKRFSTADEVAEIIYMLATNESLTGSQIVVDGGILVK